MVREAFSLCSAPLLTTLQLMKTLWTSAQSTFPIHDIGFVVYNQKTWLTQLLIILVCAV